jgi:hypothetical protein
MGEVGGIESLDQVVGLEQNPPTLEQETRESDPRDYIRITTFQKHARSVDVNPDHPWETVPDGFIWSNEPGCEIMVATVSARPDKPKGLLLAAKVVDSESITDYITDLEPSVRDFASDIIGTVARRFPVKERSLFIQEFVNTCPELVNISPDRTAFNIATLAVSLLPDYPNAEILGKEIGLPRVTYGEPEASEQQRADLQKFLTILSTKMPPDIFQESLNKFIGDIPFTDNVYGRNFKYIFSDGLGWMVASRPDTQINDSYSSFKQTDRAKTFPVKDLIKRKIDSVEQLRSVLSEMPVSPEPDTRYLRQGPSVAEFVDLEKVVGGPGITDWSVVSTSEGRGIENIKKIADNFTRGTIDVSGHDEPIHVNEVDGEYFISRDGRHRVAAMKALGIPFAPMMVTHVQ